MEIKKLILSALAAVLINWQVSVLKAQQHTYAVSKTLIDAIVYVESRGIATAQSKSGARGLMQIMPTTAKAIGCQPNRLYEPEYNIECGTKLLNHLLTWSNGDLDLALGAYYAGPKKARSKGAKAYIRRVKRAQNKNSLQLVENIL